MLRPLPNVPDQRVAHGHIFSFTPRQLVTFVWSMARLGLHSRVVYDTCGMLLYRKLKAVGDKGLTMLASTYSLPTVRSCSSIAPGLLHRIGMEAKARVESGSFVPTALADLLWELWLSDGARSRKLEGRKGERLQKSDSPMPLLAMENNFQSLVAHSEVSLPDEIMADHNRDVILAKKTSSADAVENVLRSLAAIQSSVRPSSLTIFAYVSMLT
jgi:hypothetical protein